MLYEVITFIFINTAAFILALILHVSKPLILQGQFTEYIKAVLFAATFLSVPGIFDHFLQNVAHTGFHKCFVEPVMDDEGVGDGPPLAQMDDDAAALADR